MIPLHRLLSVQFVFVAYFHFFLLYFQVQNKYLVAGKDIVIKYGLYNIGEQAALDISLSDSGFQARKPHLPISKLNFDLLLSHILGG